MQRRYPSALQVANTNFMKEWLPRLSWTFVNFHCSFIFRGVGTISINGVVHRLEAPCGFVVYPGDRVEYDAADATSFFNQLYFDFDPRYVPVIEKMRLADRSRRVWPLANPSRLWALAEELCALSQSFPLERGVDRVDRLCEQVLMESCEQAEPGTPGSRVVARVLEKMRRDPSLPFDLTETARLSNMSEATFRRHWAREVDIAPRCYLEQLRIRTASRLLIETELPIREIAGKVGFDDEFYFSRRFRALQGCSPRGYRLRHQRG